MPDKIFYFVTIYSVIFYALIYFVNYFWIKSRHKTIFGQEVGPKKPGYKNFVMLYSRTAFLVAGLVGLIYALDLAYEVTRAMSLGRPGYTNLVLFYIPIGILLLISIVLGASARQIAVLKQEGIKNVRMRLKPRYASLVKGAGKEDVVRGVLFAMPMLAVCAIAWVVSRRVGMMSVFIFAVLIFPTCGYITKAPGNSRESR